MKLYLVNYRHKDSFPCKSITQLPFEEAKVLAEKLYADSSCKAYRRFGDVFERYYEDRCKAERWMHDAFCNLGGKTNQEHPLYFTVQPSKELSESYGEYKILQIDMNDIAECDISFTLGDSMALYYTDKLNKMFTKNMLLEQLRLYNDDVNRMLENKGEQATFIEAQLWNSKYLDQIIEEKLTGK